MQVTGAVAGRGAVPGAPRQPVGNARRASPLSGGGSLRLPGQAFGDGPRTRKEGEGAEGRGPRTEAKGAPRGPGKRNGSGRS